MRLLIDNPRGLYGSEFVHLSGGKLGRGSVYTILARLVNKGYVKEVEEEPTSELQMRRTRHLITGQGAQAVQKYFESVGAQIIPGALAGGGAAA